MSWFDLPEATDSTDTSRIDRLQRRFEAEHYIQLLESINAEAEADMIRGNPITGAHHRAIEKKLAELRKALKK